MSRERSLPAVVQDIFGNFQDIVRAEAVSLKAELREEGAKVASSVLWFAVGVAEDQSMETATTLSFHKGGRGFVSV